MSFRDQLGQMRREYRRDIAQMAKAQEAIEKKVDDGLAALSERMEKVESKFGNIESHFGKIEAQFQKIELQFQKIELQFQTVKDEFGGLIAETRQVRADLLEGSRTVTGRLRLTEERLNKMLDLFESEMVDSHSLGDVLSRIEALERRTPPA